MFKKKKTTMTKWLLFSSILVLPWVFQPAESHGRLIEPPSRATMWRYGFDTPPNYNDHELYCGGYARQWQNNKGKCGVCGDAWDMPKPRPHEAGGKYGNGIIVRKYKKGAMINIRVELTANHRGFFEFRLCPNNAPHRVATQECLDLNLLKIARKGNGTFYGDEPAMFHETRYYPAAGSKVFEMRYHLPENLTCTQCILQWKYIAGNNWGMCPNGTGQVGCGPQEEFRACADVAIVDSAGEADETPYIPNEIDTEKGTKETDTGEKPKVDSEWWFLLVIIVLTTLFLVLATFALIYFYFYKRGEVKEWWEQKQLPTFQRGSREPRFWKNFKDGGRFVFWKSDPKTEEKNKNYVIPQPVPPPRTKRNKETVVREV